MLAIFLKYVHRNKLLINKCLLLCVPDPPEIAVETPVVFSGEGQEAMLVCIVHGEAQPEVNISPNRMVSGLFNGMMSIVVVPETI